MRRIPHGTVALIAAVVLAWNASAARARVGSTAPTADSTSFERGYCAYMGQQYDGARRFFERAIEEPTVDARAHAWLGFTWFRLGEPESAWREAHAALALDACSAIAWEVLSRSLNPQYGAWSRSDADSAYACLLAGVRCDSLDGDLWSDVWIGALQRGDDALAARAVRGIHDSGFYRSPLYANSRWTLADLPPRTILLVNGDADSYPTLVVQQVEHVRTDVTLVHLSLLGAPWYRRYVRDRQGVPMPLSPADLDTLDFHPDGNGGWVEPYHALVDGWLRMRGTGALERPLAMAATVYPASIPQEAKQCGAYWLLHPDFTRADADTALIRRALMKLDLRQFAGEGVVEADRSPMMRGSGAMVRNNLAMSVAEYYWHSRRAGADRRAEALRAWALASFARLDPAGEALAEIEHLPRQWQDALRERDSRK